MIGRLNKIGSEQSPGVHPAIAAYVPLDGFHLTREQLSSFPNSTAAHARRGAAFTFDAASFLELVKDLREPLVPESKTVHAPSFDHALKDPIQDDITILPTARIIVFEGNYLSLNHGHWKEAAELMDELWFVEVDIQIARQRLIARHVKSGIAANEVEAARRADESDLINGQEILVDRLAVQEVIISTEDDIR